MSGIMKIINLKCQKKSQVAKPLVILAQEDEDMAEFSQI